MSLEEAMSVNLGDFKSKMSGTLMYQSQFSMPKKLILIQEERIVGRTTAGWDFLGYFHVQER